MPNTFFPTQIGTTPSGYQGGSQVIIGRDLRVSWEAVGFGAGGRPDALENFVINISQLSGVAPIQSSKLNGWRGQISLNVNDLVNIMKTNPAIAASGFNMKFREVSVCEQVGDGTQEMKMLILASQTYPTGS